MGKRILIIGGTFTEKPNEQGFYGKSSSLINKLQEAIINHPKVISEKDTTVNCFNGGSYNFLAKIIEATVLYDIVFWMPNVENNSLPKIRNVKEIAPKVMLITSKRNDSEKYSFQELIQRALAQKANLSIEFSKIEEKCFNIRVFDPLGCVWYDGCDIKEAVNALINRLYFINSITRQGTNQDIGDKELITQTYLENNQDVKEFINIVHQYANDFHTLMGLPTDVKRFVGNCSLKATPKEFRCTKGFPSFKLKNYVFMSKRNVNKETIELDSFVPCFLENNKVFYCGNEKPSVDTPIQLRLYEQLPQINYMIHSHCYIKGAPFTNVSIPCGGIEEVDEIMNLIKNINPELDADFYHINLIGHGSLIMSKDIEHLKGVEYIKRELPEKMF